MAHFFLAAGSMWQREIVRFVREPSRVVGALATPVVFWLLIGGGLGTSFRPADAPPSTNYLHYFFPGTILLIVLFTAIFSTISLIEDRRAGFLQSVLVAPVSRGSFVLGKILGGATLALIQALLFMLVSPFVGVVLTIPRALEVAAVLLLLSLALTALGFLVAWPMESTQGFHAIMNLFLVPLWLLSGALFPASGAASLVRWVMYANPLTYGLALLRELLYPDGSPGGAGGFPSLQLSLAVTVAFTIAMIAAAWWVASRRRSTPLV
jgi:ABC-2 type transport system permease protein